jgi:hypothetical protein
MNTATNPSRKAKGIYLDLIAAAVLIFFAIQPGGAFLAVLLFLPLAFFNLAQIVRHADARKNHLLLAGIWLSAFALVYGFNVYQDGKRRQQADTLVAKIQAYQEQLPAHAGSHRRKPGSQIGAALRLCLPGGTRASFLYCPFQRLRHFFLRFRAEDLAFSPGLTCGLLSCDDTI